MDILIRAGVDDVARTAADIIGSYVKDGAVIGLATGSTPLATYRELIARHEAGALDFSGCTAFCLDEYLGLPPEHVQSYHHTIRTEFTSHINIADRNVHSPDAMDPRPWEAAQRYEQAIADAGGIDVQLLGVGTNGHIGFNEPASALNALTRVETLHPQTVVDNARFFDSPDEVPTHAITQGLGTILRSGHALLLATGAGKADAVAKMVEGPLSASCPASVLQLHRHATIIVDEAAAAGLKDAEYYHHMDAARPEWMGVDGRPRA